MNPSPEPAPLSDETIARASVLHDLAFRDPKIKEKPSWADSVAAALAEKDAAQPAASKPSSKTLPPSTPPQP